MMISELYEITDTGEKLTENWVKLALKSGNFKSLLNKKKIIGIEWFSEKGQFFQYNDMGIHSIKVASNRTQLLYSTGNEAYIYSEKSELIFKLSSPIVYKKNQYNVKLFKALDVVGDNICFHFNFNDYDYYGEVSIKYSAVVKLELCK